MSWKKHFKPVTIDGHGSHSPISGGGRPGPAKTNYSSFLPDVYAGTPNRIDRYMQYDTMDMDSEVNAALDIIAEFCTQKDKENETPFHTSFRGQPTSTEVKLIKDCLQKWCKQQQFETRIFRIIRNTFKYGDCFFLRDPETKKWLYVDPVKVSKIIANESEGKIPEQYVIKDINFNFKNLIAVTPHGITNTSPSGTASYTSGGSLARGMVGDTARSTGTRFQNAINEIAVDAKDVVHISLSEGLDNNFPFGNSLLESVFKVYKQKELLEDAVIIYRVQRAPERRIFYVDVGNMPAHMAMGFVERVKNEIQQRRIPSSTGGAAGSTVDSSYNPVGQNEDFFLPKTSEGRGSSIETLPGGCLAMDTKVPLLDGRTLSLTELTAEYKVGKENWTYSTNPETGEVVPGLISWAGVTQESAKVMRLTLDNGETLVCTPDHKFPIIGKGEVRADQLIIGESFIPFNVKNEVIATHKKLEYTQVYQNNTRDWQYVHRMVGNYFKGTTLVREYTHNPELTDTVKDTIHHVDHDRFNNKPTNLVYMNYQDHSQYHADNGFSEEAQQLGTQAALAKFNEMKQDPERYEAYIANLSEKMKSNWENLTEEDKADRVAKLKEGLRNYFDNMTTEQYDAMVERNTEKSKLGTAALQELLQDPIFNAEFTAAQREGWADFKGTPAYHARSEKLAKHGTERMADPEMKTRVFKNQTVKYDKYLLDQIQSAVINRECEVSLEGVVKHVNETHDLLDYFLSLNVNTKCANWNNDCMTVSQFKSMLKQFQYTGWKHFKQDAAVYNHKLVAIEYLDDEIEVGTLTIDQHEKYHNYHTFALSVGIFTFNSNLGEITDLRFFTNKLFRALRIPASYLPTGIEEASNTVADGKVGTAYIQEFRFNEYCKRLQNLLVQTFDLEFKLWLYSQGINIDSSLFELKFNEPQNFAAYRQSELDTTRVNIFAQLQEIPYLSKRFAMKRFLGMTQEEITENESMWREENGHTLESLVDGAGELRSAGISPSGIASDMSAQDEMAPEVPGGPEGSTGGANVAPGPMGNAAPGPTGGPMGM